MRRVWLGLLGLIGFGLALLLFWGNSWGSSQSDRASAQPFQLALPVDCRAADHCFVMLYPDRDPSPKAIDFNCGRLTYDGHKGTDFAIPDAGTMARGIPVVASAPGQVLRVRDGLPDRRQNAERSPELQGQECGNGVVVDHGDGWTTQYCHLRQGSIAVEPGDRLTTGDPIGLVGQSGLASFPHVHLQVAHNNRIVDPFVGLNGPSGCQAGNRQPLWAEPLPYQPTGEIRAGFAMREPSLGELWDGQYSQTELPRNSPALLFWVHAFGVQTGDVEAIELRDPQGEVVAQDRQPIAQSRRVWLRYTGKRASQPLTPGRWQGRYSLERNGQVLIDVEREVLLR